MTTLVLSPPKFGFIVGTRIAAAVGIGLLLSRKLSNSRRRAIGTTLLTIGIVTTIPAAIFLLRSREA